MREEICDKDRTVCVWLSRGEGQDPAVRERLAPFCQRYRERKYAVAVFYSGRENLEELTRELLRYNRKKLEKDRMDGEKGGGPDAAPR